MAKQPRPGDSLVKRLHGLYGVEKDASLARAMGVKSTAVQHWRNTGKLGQESLYKLAYTKNLRVEWIETGEGEKYKGGTKDSLLRALVECWPQLEPARRETMALCAQVLAHGDATIHSYVRSRMGLLDEALRLRQVGDDPHGSLRRRIDRILEELIWGRTS